MSSYWSDFYEGLIANIEERSSASLERVEEAVRKTRDLEESAPGILAMACWGEAGFDRIKEIAISQRSSKKSSSALKTFSLLAAGAEIDPITFFVVHQRFLEYARVLLKPNEILKISARKALYDFVHATNTDDFLIPLGVAFTQIAFADQRAAEELVNALATKWLKFGPNTIAQYIVSCSVEANNEPFFQKFFEEYSQILDPMVSQVWSEFDLQGMLRPDFVVRRSDDSYLIVEIECPSKKLMTVQNQLSTDAIHAEKQTMQYKEFFAERLRETRSIMPFFSDPECLIVIGMENELNDRQKKRSEGSQ